MRNWLCIEALPGVYSTCMSALRQSAALLAAALGLGVVGCSSTGGDEFLVEPEVELSDESKIREMFAGWERGEDGLPDRSLRSGFEGADPFSRRDYRYTDRQRFQAGSVDREEYGGTRAFNASTRGHMGVAEEAGEGSAWSRFKSGFGRGKYDTGAGAAEGGRTYAGAAAQPSIARESGMDRRSSYDRTAYTAPITDSPAAQMPARTESLARQLGSLPADITRMSVEQVRDLLAPGEDSP